MTSTQTFSPTILSDSEIAAGRAHAVNAFIANAKRLSGLGGEGVLDVIAQQLVALGLRRELFPEHHFPVHADRPNAVYRLAEDPDGRYALFVSAGLAGKFQPPHDHTTWAMIAGIRGNERNVVYRRSKTDDPRSDRLEHVRTVDVKAGSYVTLAPDDVHTIELVDGENGLHLHFYGLSLERLTERVVFEGKEGGAYRQFSPPALIRHPVVAPRELKEALKAGEELAVLDVREEGVFARQHLLYASNAPLWRLELAIDALVPRRSTPVVLTDLDESLAHHAAAKLARLGYHNVRVLEGGTLGWEREGFEVYSGVNVPSKAFGELIETRLHTPTIEAEDLQQRLAAGQNLVVVDSRTPEEFQNFSLPGARSVPGAELVYRIGEIAPDPSTLVVVNCAGRTRSILGAQTLINAAIPNPVVSLKDGTMAWLISGRELVRGRKDVAPEPSAERLETARRQARFVAEKAGVKHISADVLATFEAQADKRSLYKFDVRTRAEYQSGHLPGWRWAPGGQLVQATDEYIGTRHARVVIADWDGVRALTTAAWLAQLGGVQVFLYTPTDGAELETGAERGKVLSSSEVSAPWVDAATLAEWLQADGDASPAVFDVDSSLVFAKEHVAGARFSAPDRIAEFIATVALDRRIVITSSDGILARSVAAQLIRKTGRPVAALLGGTAEWVRLGLPVASGRKDILTGDDDAWYSPYAYESPEEREAQMRAYLAWEIGLVEQLQRDDHTISLANVAA